MKRLTQRSAADVAPLVVTVDVVPVTIRPQLHTILIVVPGPVIRLALVPADKVHHRVVLPHETL